MRIISTEVNDKELSLLHNLNQMCHFEDEQAIFVKFHDNTNVIQLFSRMAQTVDVAKLGRARSKYLTS